MSRDLEVSTLKVTDMFSVGTGVPGVQGAALTTQSTTITHTAPGTPDYAIQNVTQTSPFGFVTADEANTVFAGYRQPANTAGRGRGHS